MDVAIRTRGLTKRFGATTALSDLDLTVPAGVVLGYLGPNGAGKTTTLRILAGLLRPTAGTAHVFGHDVVTDRLAVQGALGYLPGDFAAPANLTGRAYLTYLRDLRGGVAWSDVELLAKRLELDLDRHVHDLSHGNRQKVGLVQAFAHHPRLLVLDEPTSGLDPLVQQEVLAMVREARDRGATVLLSSHVLSEVDAVADVVGILRAGRLVAFEEVAALRAKALRRIELTFAGEVPDVILRVTPGVRDLRVVGRTASVVVEGSTAALWAAAAPHGVADVVTHEADLEEIFLAYYAEGARS